MKDFNATRAAFILIASVIGVHAATIVTSDIQCFLADRPCTEITNSLRDLLMESMATVLAFTRLGPKP